MTRAETGFAVGAAGGEDFVAAWANDGARRARLASPNAATSFTSEVMMIPFFSKSLSSR
jgi:hypothetical protein